MMAAPAANASGAAVQRRPVIASLAAIAAISVLVSFAPAPGADLFREEAHNAGHVVVFAIVGFLLRPLLSARFSTAVAIATSLIAELSLPRSESCNGMVKGSIETCLGVNEFPGPLV